jgi:GNAT superfamily N-acetyltransferase
VSIVEENVDLRMVREDLREIPRHALPAGYAIRPYCAGDEHAWVDIHVAADRYNEITLDLFRREFGDDPDVLEQRLSFLVDASGSAVGVAAAWFGDEGSAARLGRLHWVAIHPAHQGQGLAKPLLHRVLVAMRELGHVGAVLTTSTARIPAITLYLRFGFAPAISGPDDAATWAALRPFLPERARYRLAGLG